MGEYVVYDKWDVLTTKSLGPCIAIGVRHKEWLALLHQFGPSQGSPEVPLFFQDLAELIPAHVRRNLGPVVAGGKLDFEHDGEDAVVNAGTFEDSALVLSELARLGFAAPHVCGGITAAKCQAVRLEKSTSTAVVTTEAWDGTLSSKAVPLPPT
jgi:hypothetical protein